MPMLAEAEKEEQCVEDSGGVDVDVDVDGWCLQAASAKEMSANPAAAKMMMKMTVQL